MQPNSTKATIQATLQPASTSKYLASDKVKRIGSSRPLKIKQDNLQLNENHSNSGKPSIGPKSTGNVPMRKIGADQFYKPTNNNSSALNTSSS